MGRPDLAILIPCHNEAQTLGPVVREAVRHGEVFVVDDRSSDGSGDVARRAGAAVVNAAAPGYDGALETGLRHAFAKGFARLVTLDADGEHDPALVGAFDARLKTAPLVCGVRRRPQRLAEHLVGWAALRRYGLHDILCGMKGYSRPVIERWIASGAPLGLNMVPAIQWRADGGAFDEMKVTGTPRLGDPRFGRALAANRAILRAYVRAVRAA